MNKHHNTPKLLRRWVSLFAFVAFAAAGCGGGSDGNNGSDPSVRPTPPPPGISLLTGSIGGPGNIEGIGAAARFNQPGGVAVDAAGNAYAGGVDYSFTTAGTAPMSAAATPDSKAPSSFEAPMKTAFTALTRPRMPSGVSSCTSMWRM